MEQIVVDWLDTRKPSTRSKYKLYVTRMQEYFGKSATEIKEEYDALESAKDLKEFSRKYGQKLQALYENDKIPLIGVGAVRSWFRDVTASVTHCKIKPKRALSIYYKLTTPNLRAMMNVATLDEQVKLAVGNNLGLRPIDICLLEKQPFLKTLGLIDEGHSSYSEEPYVVPLMTKKQGIAAVACLMDETLNLLREYLNSAPNDSDFLFVNKNGERIRPTQLNIMLRALYKKAYPQRPLPSKFSWKCFRKRLKSLMAKSGIVEVYRNAVAGHDTGLAGHYELGHEGAEEDVGIQFKKVIPQLRIYPAGPSTPKILEDTTKRIEKLEYQTKQIKQLEKNLETIRKEKLDIHDLIQVNTEFLSLLNYQTKGDFKKLLDKQKIAIPQLYRVYLRTYLERKKTGTITRETGIPKWDYPQRLFTKEKEESEEE